MAHAPAPAPAPAPVPPHVAMRPSDFLPDPKFSGENVTHEKAISHWYLFIDYLQMHGLANPVGAQMQDVTVRFRLSLIGNARLWIQDKVFPDLDAMKEAFIRRFSPTHSEFANVRYFEELSYKQGESAEQYLQRVRIAAQRINYNAEQIRHKYLHSLPQECKRAVAMSAAPDATAEDYANLAQKYLDLGQSQTGSKTVSFVDEVHTTSMMSSSEDNNLRTDMAELRKELKSIEEQLHATQQQQREVRDDRHRSPSPGMRRTRGRYQYRDRHRSRSPSRPRSRTPSTDRRCPSPSRANYSQAPRCFFCHRIGHVWRKCWDYQRLSQPGYQGNPERFQPPGPPDRGYQQGYQGNQERFHPPGPLHRGYLQGYQGDQEGYQPQGPPPRGYNADTADRQDFH